MIQAVHQAGSAIMEDASFTAILTSVFVGSLVSGMVGFAFSAVAGAILFHWVTPMHAVPLLLACSITTQLFSIARLWRTLQWSKCTPFLIGGFVGIPFGAMLLQGLSPHMFGAAFGIFLVCYSAYMLLKFGIVIERGSRAMDMAAGFAGGVTGGAIAFPGAIPTIWCSLRGLSKHEQRSIVQPFILLMQIATLVYFSKLGILASSAMLTYLWCIPAVLGGTWLGLYLFHHIDDVMFRRLVLVFLLVSGTALIL